MPADETAPSGSADEFEAFLRETLDYREREVIKLLYGLGDGFRYTYEEVSRIFKVTEPEVQWIEQAAIRKLQQAPAALKIANLALAAARPLYGQVDDEFVAALVEDAKGSLAELGIELPAEEERDRQHIQAIGVLENMKELDPYLIGHLKSNESDLTKLSGDLFEKLVAEFLASRDFDKVRLVGKNDLTGADVLAIENSEASGGRIRYFIEIKRWKDRVGIEVVRSVLGAIQLEEPEWGWNCGMLVSLSGFKDFKTYTRRDLEYRGVHLRGPDVIRQWMRDYRPSDKGLWLPPSVRYDLSDVGGPHQKE